MSWVIHTSGTPRVGQLASQVLDRAPRRGVERGSRFVGQEHERLGQQRSCDRHALRLAPAELVGRSIEQLPGHADVIEHVVRTVQVECGQRHLEVVEHRAREDRRGLEDHGDPAAELTWLPLGDVSTVQRDRARHRIVESVEQPQQRRLARARRSGHGQDALARNLQRDSLEDRRIRRPGDHVDQLERRGSGHGGNVPVIA